MSNKKIMVSGCFDMLHSGHVEFFRQASKYGGLYVALGSDKTIFDLKGRQTVNDQNERLFIVNSVRFVTEAFISNGSGILDFSEELTSLKPDYFMVNEDGHIPEKEELCKSLGINYLIAERKPFKNLIPRSTTELRLRRDIPYRIDLAGGWLDQPYVSEFHPGSVVTLSIEPTIEFNLRSGMATSTRNRIPDLWGTEIPPGNYEILSKVLFCYDNPPGTEIISGSQDSIGLVYPGLAKANYDGAYWPISIDHVTEEISLRFVEDALYMIPIGLREPEYDVLVNTNINSNHAKLLADASENLWAAIHKQDIIKFGKAMREGFEGQVRMFPNMMTKGVDELILQYQDSALGWKLSGAGGGGYLILVSEKPIPDAIKVTARRERNIKF